MALKCPLKIQTLFNQYFMMIGSINYYSEVFNQYGCPFTDFKTNHPLPGFLTLLNCEIHRDVSKAPAGIEILNSNYISPEFCFIEPEIGSSSG